jgi:hypothetical protein
VRGTCHLLAHGERPQLVVSGFGHLDVSALVRPLPGRVVRGSQLSAVLGVRRLRRPGPAVSGIDVVRGGYRGGSRR